VVIVGAGIAGLVAAAELAAQGENVLVLERAPAPGGKMRQVAIGGALLDAGPTVLTMPGILEEIFARTGTSLAAELELQPARILARHAWDERARLDLFADHAQTQAAIGRFAGAGEARRYQRFCSDAAGMFRTLEHAFLRAHRPTAWSLVAQSGFRGLTDLWRIRPFTTLADALSRHFHDPRLRQLFGRYATYSGSSPFAAPATLMLIAHVEQRGVWLVRGGMHQIALALERCAAHHGATFRYSTEVTKVLSNGGRASGVRLGEDEDVPAKAVVVNADAAAVAAGLLGQSAASAVPRAGAGMPSLSAVTWAMLARTEGFPLTRHTVFFSRDYRAEFDAIFRDGRIPAEPTVYVCGQDRNGDEDERSLEEERLLCLINAPAMRDGRSIDRQAVEASARAAFRVLSRCGLRVRARSDATIVSTPADFAAMFPGTGGTLYGRAMHGWRAAFQRPGARTALPGLYLAGGSVHPGPGIPMAALSGRLAAACLRADCAKSSAS